MKGHIVAALVLSLATGTAIAQDWFPLNRDVALRVGSYEARVIRDTDAVVATAIVRFRIKGDESYMRVGVLAEDCVNGYGRLNSYYIGTGNYAYSNDFVFGGTNPSSTLALALCQNLAKDYRDAAQQTNAYQSRHSF